MNKFAKCVEQMTGFLPNMYWIVCWSTIAPLVMGVIFIFYCVQWEPVKYGTVVYPDWAHIIGKKQPNVKTRLITMRSKPDYVEFVLL